MKRSAIRAIVILGVISIAGILIVQVFWMRKAFDLRNKQFEHNVNIALMNVTNSLCEINKEVLPADPIEQLSSNYFIVNINNRISPNTLESILKSEFTQREIADDFEYGIFDCTNEEMVYGNYVNLSNQGQSWPIQSTFPKLNKDAYYFGVYFPNKPADIVGQMSIWTFSSTILFVVVIFFGYALFIILKQRRLSEIQKDFINNMTHEFKTPIATIAVSSEVLKSKDIASQPERLSNYANIIDKETKRLKSQVDRVLQMATVEKNQINLKIESVELNGLLSNAIENARLSHQNTSPNIEHPDSASEIYIEGDRLHLGNIIDNLLDNAVKYCQSNPKVVVKITERKRDVSIAIKDNGQGIDPKHLSMIFKKFYRIPTGNVHDVKGFGLGLYYVKVIVDSHGGDIKVESDKTGTRFTINLPKKTMTDKKILLVEDDESLGFVTKDNLDLKGYDVCWCKDGKEAWSAFQKVKFDLCLLDIMLPKLDGMTLATNIRNVNTIVPIIFLTAKSLQDDKLAGFEIGADDYITKPFSVEELIYRIEVFLKRSRVIEEKVGIQKIGNFKFDAGSFLLTNGTNTRKLTRRESEILQFLLQRKNEIVKREEILMTIWGDDDYFKGRSLDVFISKLRKYLADDPDIDIENFHGIGFKLTCL